MNAFFFGTRSRQLFGIYHAAGESDGPTRAAVLCNPWGSEYTNAHRAVRQAAILLAAAGLHTLRFDYFGTGDSAGDMEQASLEMWEDDIRAGVREVAEISGARHVALIGLRFGALLAARVATDKLPLVDQLVLWDPIVDGRAYLEELFRTSSTQVQRYQERIPRPAAVGGGFEVFGYPITDAMARAIQGREMGSLAAQLPQSTDVLLSGNSAEATRVRKALIPPLAPAAIERIEAPPCWLEEWPPSTRSLPAALLSRLVERTKGFGSFV